jgi:hydroxymethylpyrimidine pyrophosphatase-like HAD family hydrolase
VETKIGKEARFLITKPLIIAVDFDLTLADINPNTFEILSPRTKMFRAVKRAQHLGHHIVLWTARAGRFLDEAVEFCKEHDLEFEAVNENCAEAVRQFEELNIEESRKIYADYYLDDKAIDLGPFLLLFGDHLGSISVTHTHTE